MVESTLFAGLDAVAARVDAAAIAAVTAALTPVFEESLARVPDLFGHLKQTGRLQVEASGGAVNGRISYGDAGTVTKTGTGYEVYTHEGNGPPGEYIYPTHGPLLVFFDWRTNRLVKTPRVRTSAPLKYLEGPLLEQQGEMEATMGHAFTEAMEAL